MSALPTLGGNNGSASDINSRAGKSQELRKRLSLTPEPTFPYYFAGLVQLLFAGARVEGKQFLD
jgi:hypothetical protein